MNNNYYMNAENKYYELTDEERKRYDNLFEKLQDGEITRKEFDEIVWCDDLDNSIFDYLYERYR